VERAKRRAREEMDAAAWRTHGYAALDLDALLGKAEGNCSRVHISDLSPASFSQLYESKPCVIEGMLDGWAARDWAPEALADRFGGAKFKCGDTEAGHKVTISLRAYDAYTRAQVSSTHPLSPHNHDDNAVIMVMAMSSWLWRDSHQLSRHNHDRHNHDDNGLLL